MSGLGEFDQKANREDKINKSLEFENVDLSDNAGRITAEVNMDLNNEGRQQIDQIGDRSGNENILLRAAEVSAGSGLRREHFGRYGKRSVKTPRDPKEQIHMNESLILLPYDQAGGDIDMQVLPDHSNLDAIIPIAAGGDVAIETRNHERISNSSLQTMGWLFLLLICLLVFIRFSLF